MSCSGPCGFPGRDGHRVSFAFVPLAIGWIWIRRTRAAVAVGVAYGVGLVLQGITMLTAGSNLTVVPPERPFKAMANLVGVRSFTLYLVGPDGAARLWDDYGRTSWIVSGLLLVGLFAVACWRAERRAQVLGVVLFLYGVGQFMVLVWSRGTPPFSNGAGTVQVMTNLRYSVAPTLMTASVFAVVLAPRRRLARSVGCSRRSAVVHRPDRPGHHFPRSRSESSGPRAGPGPPRSRTATEQCLEAPADATVDIAMDRLRLTRNHRVVRRPRPLATICRTNPVALPSGLTQP